MCWVTLWNPDTPCESVAVGPRLAPVVSCTSHTAQRAVRAASSTQGCHSACNLFPHLGGRESLTGAEALSFHGEAITSSNTGQLPSTECVYCALHAVPPVPAQPYSEEPQAQLNVSVVLKFLTALEPGLAFPSCTRLCELFSWTHPPLSLV
jgi:hypothetical protein